MSNSIQLQAVRRFLRKRQEKRLLLLAAATATCILTFRFDKEHLLQLTDYLALPEIVITENRLHATAIEALCMFLRRYCYPNRLFDCMQLFGRTPCEVSRFTTLILHHIYDNFHYLLNTFNHHRLTSEVLERFAHAIADKGGALPDTFIDGTIRPIARPGQNQRLVYNGHKRIHALKFQSVMTPDGIISHFTGPWVGHRHDSWMLTESGLYQELEIYAHGMDGRPMRIYGDSAYTQSNYIISSFKGAHITEEQALINTSMSRVRECVEWGFGKITMTFAFMDFKKNQKVYLQPIGLMYTVAVLMTNIHSCFYGSQTSQYFNLDPLSVYQYLNIEQ